MLRGTNSSPDNLQEQLNKLQMRLDNPDSEIFHHPFKGVFDPFIDLKNLFPEEMQEKFSVIIDYNQTDLSAGQVSVSIKYNNYLLKKIVIDNALRLNNDDIEEYIKKHFNVEAPKPTLEYKNHPTPLTKTNGQLINIFNVQTLKKYSKTNTLLIV